MCNEENLHLIILLLSFSAVSSPLAEKEKEQTPSSSIDHVSCQQCGGNGYMKTSPTCYHTCLNCLGRGLIPHFSNKNHL